MPSYKEAIIKQLRYKLEELLVESIEYISKYIFEQALTIEIKRELVKVLMASKSPQSYYPLLDVLHAYNDRLILRFAEIGIKRILKKATIDDNGIMTD